MDDRAVLGEILTELKLIRQVLEAQGNVSQGVQRNEIFIPPKVMTLTLGLRKIDKGHYFLYTIDVPGKYDEPIKQGGYFKEEDEDIATLLAITSALEGTAFLKKHTDPCLLNIANAKLAKEVGMASFGYVDATRVESGRRNEKLWYTADRVKQLTCTMNCTTATDSYRMKKIEEELFEIHQKFKEKENANSNRDDLRSDGTGGEEVG